MEVPTTETTAMQVEFTLNGAKRSLEVEAERTLLEVIREDLGLTGTKYGCGEGDCRACTVLIDRKPMPSCQVLAANAGGKAVTTIEGLSEGGKLHPVQRAFIDAGAMQCGYCVPGMILQAVSLLDENPRPGDGELVEAMDSHLCRCCNYINILEALRMAARARRENP
jgi:aerobic-type carbon monoxide dehydrogenase small subunit (CoxS/CutS family)